MQSEDESIGSLGGKVRFLNLSVTTARIALFDPFRAYADVLLKVIKN